MIELLLVIVLTLIGTAERIVSGRRYEAERAAWVTERERLQAIILAQDVTPAVALSVARPKAEPAEPRPPRKPPIGL